MTVDEALELVKKQLEYHQKMVAKDTLDRPGPARFQQGLADNQIALHEFIRSLADENGRLQSSVGSDINGRCASIHDKVPKRPQLRLGDISELPEELRKQLNSTKVGAGDQEIIDVIRERFDGVAVIDEILVGLYQATGQIRQRGPISQKLYRMTTNGLLHAVPRKKGMYSVEPVAPNEDEP